MSPALISHWISIFFVRYAYQGDLALQAITEMPAYCLQNIIVALGYYSSLFASSLGRYFKRTPEHGTR
jgi:hypothetical protein